MIDKSGKSYFLVCDICGDEDDNVFDCWSEAADYSKDNKEWKRKYEGGGWINICPACQK